MNSKMLKKVLVAAFLVLPVMTFAQSEEKKEEGINLKGKIFMNWTNQFESKDNGVDQEDDHNTFKVERIYLTWKKALDDVFSIRVTTDIQATQETEDTDGKSGLKGYNVYAKYAYLQGKKKFGDVEFKTMIGLTKTTTIGFIDDELTGTRWLNNNFIDKSKNLLTNKNGNSVTIDHSADLGVNLGLKYAKMVEFQAAYVNGEGYKAVHDDTTESDDGKQIGTRLTIMPIESLYINGYFTHNDNSTKSSTGDNYTRYYGGGAAWANDMLRIGANYVIVKQKVEDEDQGDMWLLDSWIKFDLDSVAAIPVFLYGRYGIGENKDVDNSQTTYIGGGLGYTYSKNLQVAAYYNQLEQDTDEETKESQFQVKAEVKF